MALFPYPRLAQLFEAIQAESLPQEELAKRFSVSSRTIRTDISTLNDILHLYGAKIAYKRGKGYALHIEDHLLFSSLPKQQQVIQTIPRAARDRVDALLLKLLLASHPIKLDDIAEAWCISRGTLQHDMSAIREIFSRYSLRLESIPHLGTRLKGDERLVRACLTDTLSHQFLHHSAQGMALSPFPFNGGLLAHIDLADIAEILQNSLSRFNIQLTDEGRQYLIFNCAASLLRLCQSHSMAYSPPDQPDSAIQQASEEISTALAAFLDNEMPLAEIHYLGTQIAAQRIPQHDDPVCRMHESLSWVDKILNDINTSYNYDLRHDSKLRNDLAAHLSLLTSRLQHQISSKNPLLADIKQYYPFAYEVTVSALARIEDKLPGVINENELGYLAVHIAVGLERHYGTGNNRAIPVLLVTDAGNAIRRMIEAQIARKFPQLKIQRALPFHEYNKLAYVEEDFIITTLHLTDKNKPITRISPFPTPYQLEMIGKLTIADQSRAYILERFFDRHYFMVIKEDITQSALFKKVCRKLQLGGYIHDDFYPSLIERESIVSTLLGENIALPHTLGLLALKTVVVTILAPNGVEWNKETRERANVIFLLAISKEDYEEAMSIYDLFVTFIREKATKRLLHSRNFDDFQLIAKDSLGRAR
ncbi:transcriptional regulator [Xenorhabdus mauleonii]|uniref:Transcriptional antiterminator, BglG family n=1 Tax=Xenorhabdus mauleonii TaxID=351675 RepID=A0A1I3PI82_9GAMM|nr:PRD domain-containing protein [Xenorhabdus mauleonii]PHM44791.1 transcriptional regulator [Xenorhabdus mauleonii]SFJ21193.1 transcriptional antiterminator, BglG family [Xenorhabdus mauleonii]